MLLKNIDQLILENINKTVKKFGYPDTCLWEGKHWVILLREKQPTLGSLILAIKGNFLSINELKKEALLELKDADSKINEILAGFSPDKINWIKLMMIDPFLHFHIIPRYSKDVEFNGKKYADPGWPRHPNMLHDINLSKEDFAELLNKLKLGLS